MKQSSRDCMWHLQRQSTAGVMMLPDVMLSSCGRTSREVCKTMHAAVYYWSSHSITGAMIKHVLLIRQSKVMKGLRSLTLAGSVPVQHLWHAAANPHSPADKRLAASAL